MPKMLKNNWPVLLLAAVVLFSFAPLLFFGYAFFGEEQIGFYYPQSFFYAKALNEGSSLAWNNFYYGGVSVGMDQFVSAFYPLHQLLFRWFDFFTAHHVSIAIAVFGGCFFAYWFGRASGFSRTGAFLFSTTYLSATTIVWIAIGTLTAHSFFVLPPLLLALLKISQQKQPFLFFLLGSICLGVGFLAGFMQIIFYVYAVAFLYALFLDWQRRREPGSFVSHFRAFFSLASITVLAFLIGARQILPSIFLIDETVRNATFAVQKTSVPYLTEFLGYFIPPIEAPFLHIGAPGFYMGILPFIAAILGVFFYRTPVSLFFLGLYGAMVGFAFHIPVFSWINNHLPPFSHMGSSGRWLIPGALALAYLAAHGFEGIKKGVILWERSRRVFVGIGLMFLVVVVAGIAANIVLPMIAGNQDFQENIIRWYFGARTPQFPMEHYHNVFMRAVEDIMAGISLTNWGFLIPFLLIPLSYILILSFLRQRISEKFLKVSVILIVIINVVIVFGSWFRTFVTQKTVIQEPQIIREIKEMETDLNSFRIAGFLVGDSMAWEIFSKFSLTPQQKTAILREAIVNNVNVFHGVQKLNGMEPYGMRRHNQLIETVLFPRALGIFDAENPKLAALQLNQLWNAEVLRDVSLEEKKKEFLSYLPLLSMLNVRYIYSLTPLKDPRLEKIPFEQSPDMPVPLYLYQNVNVLPRMYFADAVTFVSGREVDILQRIIQGKDFRKDTFVECSVCLASVSGRNTFEVIEYKRGYLHVKAKTERGGWFVFGESNVPGWSAEIDGIPAPLYTANYIFQTVYVPSGEHEITFSYNDIALLKWQELKNWIRK